VNAGVEEAMRMLLTHGLSMLAAASGFCATQEEIWKIYRGGEPAKAALLGVEALREKPGDIDLHQVTGRAFVDSGQHLNALPHLEKVTALDVNRSWQSAWALAYAGYAHFGLGEQKRAEKALADSLAIRATRNVESFARRGQALLGFATNYANWTTVGTEHFLFHFAPEIPAGTTNRFIAAHEAAFTKINTFFNAAPPKRTDFFVWAQSEDAQRAGLGTLGFARPELCIVHAAANQTVGHEMTHVLCGQGIKPVKTTALINEGVAVHFDQTRRNRMETARRAVRDAKLDAVSITELWEKLRSKSDGITYPVAGAFVARLHEKGGDAKLKALLRDQTLENARKVYGPELDAWIREFETELVKP
jgi:hypothetical protein